jgi:hypothetical protein
VRLAMSCSAISAGRLLPGEPERPVPGHDQLTAGQPRSRMGASSRCPLADAWRDTPLPQQPVKQQAAAFGLDEPAPGGSVSQVPGWYA